jgi:ATP-dependent DNA ligase
VAPQLALSRPALPEGEGWSYEAKWDGFRAIVFVDGAAVVIQSRNGRPLERYFPEISFPEGRYVLDGEIVIGDETRQDFGALQQRIHPAKSRIERLAAETPAHLVAFDLLALGDDVLMSRPLSERREILSSIDPAIGLASHTLDPRDAEKWLETGEGVVAKRLDAPYLPGERRGMVKVKRLRTIDCVVVGWRPGKEEGTVGALILGLYDAAGELVVMGHTSGFTRQKKRELVEFLAPYATGESGSGGPSRWSAGRDLGWVAVRPELVVEISYDHTSDGRIRHGARFIRFRSDRDPASCRLDQLS